MFPGQVVPVLVPTMPRLLDKEASISILHQSETYKQQICKYLKSILKNSEDSFFIIFSVMWIQNRSMRGLLDPHERPGSRLKSGYKIAKFEHFCERCFPIIDYSKKLTF